MAESAREEGEREVKTARRRATVAELRARRDPKRWTFARIVVASIGGGVAIAAVTYLSLLTNQILLMAPLVSTCALVFVAPWSEFAQPRNVIGGHVVSAIVGLAGGAGAIGLVVRLYARACRRSDNRPRGGSILPHHPGLSVSVPLDLRGFGAKPPPGRIGRRRPRGIWIYSAVVGLHDRMKGSSSCSFRPVWTPHT